MRPPNLSTSYTQSEFQYSLETNSMGFRDVERSQTKPPKVKRILCLGDSFTEGFGAGADSTWPSILSRRLAFLEDSFEVINAGVYGTDPVIAFEIYKRHFKTFDIDHVILAINGSERFDFFVRNGRECFLESGTVKFMDPPKFEWIF